jgi:hypothetical protein
MRHLLVVSTLQVALLSSPCLGQVISPFPESSVNSPFGPRDPGTSNSVFHRGLDFLQGPGVPIPSFIGGDVWAVYLNRSARGADSAGNNIQIRTSNGHLFKYLHMLKEPVAGVALDESAAQRFEMRDLSLVCGFSAVSLRVSFFPCVRTVLIDHQLPARILSDPVTAAYLRNTLRLDPKRIEPARIRTYSVQANVSSGQHVGSIGKSGAKGYHLHLSAFKDLSIAKSPATFISNFTRNDYRVSFDDNSKDKTLFLSDLYDFAASLPRPNRPKGVVFKVDWTNTGVHLDGLSVYGPSIGEVANLDYDGSFIDPSGAVVTKADVFKGQSALACLSLLDTSGRDVVCPQPWYTPTSPLVTLFGVGFDLLKAAGDMEQNDIILYPKSNFLDKGPTPPLKLTIARPKGQISVTGSAVNRPPPGNQACSGTMTYSAKAELIVLDGSRPTMRLSDSRETINVTGPCGFSQSTTGVSGDVPLTGLVTERVYPFNCSSGNCTGSVTLQVTLNPPNGRGLTGTVRYTNQNTNGFSSTAAGTIQ